LSPLFVYLFISNILKGNKCVLKYIIEIKIEGTLGRGRRRKQLLDDAKETTEYGKLKAEALDRTFWELALEEVNGPVVRHTV